MKTFYEKKIINSAPKGETYICDNPLFNSCTLFRLKDGRGIAVIQQRFNDSLKVTWWSAIDSYINADASGNRLLQPFLEKAARLPDENGYYPVVTVRQFMWALRMKPLKHEFWETKF